MATYAIAIRFKAEEVRSLDAASIPVATYVMGNIGDPLEHPARQFFIQNLTDATLMFSFNGATDHFPLPPSGFFLNDITSNKSVSQGLFLAQGDSLYVQTLGAPPTTGAVYFSVFYASDN